MFHNQPFCLVPRFALTETSECTNRQKGLGRRDVLRLQADAPVKNTGNAGRQEGSMTNAQRNSLASF